MGGDERATHPRFASVEFVAGAPSPSVQGPRNPQLTLSPPSNPAMMVPAGDRSRSLRLVLRRTTILPLSKTRPYPSTGQREFRRRGRDRVLGVLCDELRLRLGMLATAWDSSTSRRARWFPVPIRRARRRLRVVAGASRVLSAWFLPGGGEAVSVAPSTKDSWFGARASPRKGVVVMPAVLSSHDQTSERQKAGAVAQKIPGAFHPVAFGPDDYVGDDLVGSSADGGPPQCPSRNRCRKPMAVVRSNGYDACAPIETVQWSTESSNVRRRQKRCKTKSTHVRFLEPFARSR